MSSIALLKEECVFVCVCVCVCVCLCVYGRFRKKISHIIWPASVNLEIWVLELKMLIIFKLMMLNEQKLCSPQKHNKIKFILKLKYF